MERTDLQQQAADLLWEAEQTHTAIDPLTELLPDLRVSDSYTVQLINISRKLDIGRSIKGHKVGLSSKAMQKMMGVNEPDYGHLLNDFFYKNGDTINTRKYFIPRIEVELAYVLGTTLPAPNCTVKDVLNATEYIQPAIELIDSRIKDWKIKLVDTISDNASSAGLIMGGDKVKATDFSPRLVGANLSKNGEIIATGAMGGVLNDPTIAVAWLANKVHQFGVTLEAGHVILPGSCTKAFDVNPGDQVVAEYDGLGKIDVGFS